MATYQKEIKFFGHPLVSLVIEDTPDLKPANEITRFESNFLTYIKTGEYCKKNYQDKIIEKEGLTEAIKKINSSIQKPVELRGLFQIDTTHSGLSKAAENHTLEPVNFENKNKFKKILGAHGISRHSPYGTRFIAEMPDGKSRESFIAGDLLNRKRSGKGLSKLSLVLHEGENTQLERAWNFLKKNSHSSAGKVLDHLVSLNMDINYRKNGVKIARADASNFFKRVKDYGTRKG